MVEILGKLGIDGTIYYQFGIFIVLAIALKKTLFSPLQSVIESRESQTTGLQGAADKIIHEANQIKEDVEKNLSEKRQELYLDLKTKKANLESQLQAKFENSERDAEELFNKNYDELKQELTLVNERLSKNTDELSGLLTSKLTK